MLNSVVYGFLTGVMIFASSPTSTNYVLPAYDIGTGGTDNSTSTNFRINGIAGAQSGSQQSSTSYSLKSGLNPTQDASVPPAPALSNPSNYYDRLLLVINTGSNPSDTRYLVAISSDGFATTNYVQPDNSIGASYSLATFRTYASYGGGSGFLILGLDPATTYTVRVKAIRGNFSESAFGPATTGVATSGQILSFALATTLTTTPPYVAQFSNIVSQNVATADADIAIEFSTNATNGAAIYVASSNSALFSASQGYSIASNTVDLALAASGYGAQVIAASQASGGPIVAQPPYNGTADTVGQLSSSVTQMLLSPSPVTTASATVRLKAKPDALSPATSDYTDTITVTVAANY